ncbi:hypothetical protein GGD57_002561 [Rhizobium esperanzae]|uniref:Uncharacterized protein n=1 Tax=Rhizobium esperanzae TaxID=1967781 RepID=A0A7W6R3F4_9HYPH|nr:hypothetical protein [Rhizobium esperanzae]
MPAAQTAGILIFGSGSIKKAEQRLGCNPVPLCASLQSVDELSAATLSKPCCRTVSDARPASIKDWAKLRADLFYRSVDPAAIAEFQHRRQIAVERALGRGKRRIGEIVPEIKPRQNHHFVVGRQHHRALHHSRNRNRIFRNSRLHGRKPKPKIAIRRHARQRIPKILARTRCCSGPGVIVDIDVLPIELRQNEGYASRHNVGSAIMPVNNLDTARSIFSHDIIGDSPATLDPFGDDRDACRSDRRI